MNYEISITIVDGVPKSMRLVDEAGDDVDTLDVTFEDIIPVIKMFSRNFFGMIDSKGGPAKIYLMKSEEVVDDIYTEEKESAAAGAKETPSFLETSSVSTKKTTPQIEEESHIKPKVTKKTAPQKEKIVGKTGMIKKQPIVVTKPCKMKIRQGPRKGASCGKQSFKYGKCPYHWGIWRKAHPFMRTPKSY